MRSIASHPGAAVFRSTLVIILILICMTSFLTYTASLSSRAEQVARQRVITEIRQALAMMLYDYAIKGQLEDLKSFDRKNPFVPLAIYRQLPKNYHGAVSNVAEIKSPGWYFELNTGLVIYKSADDALPVQKFEMVYEVDDLEINPGYLAIKKV